MISDLGVILIFLPLAGLYFKFYGAHRPKFMKKTGSKPVFPRALSILDRLSQSEW